MKYETRLADIKDIPQITLIYNQGIEDRIATLETRLRTVDEMYEWFEGRGERFKVIAAFDENGEAAGWASLNEFSPRECYRGVAGMSIYIKRSMRGKGIGKQLLNYLFDVAGQQDFHKIVLNMLEFNAPAKKLYTSLGFKEVGTYMEHGVMDGKYINVTIMEKLLK